MGAVRTAGRGRELEASEFMREATFRYDRLNSKETDEPPAVERTLTVGREAIVADSLEVLTLPSWNACCVDMEN